MAFVAQNGQWAVSPGQRPGYILMMKYAQKGQKHYYHTAMLLPFLGAFVCCPHTQGVAQGWLRVALSGRSTPIPSFFPHHRCSYSMVSDCKSDTTPNPPQLQIRHNRHNRCHGSLRLKYYLECVFKIMFRIRSTACYYKYHYKYEF